MLLVSGLLLRVLEIICVRKMTRPAPDIGGLTSLLVINPSVDAKALLALVFEP